MSKAEVITLTEITKPKQLRNERIDAILSFAHGGTYQVRLDRPKPETLEDLHDTFLRDGTSTEGVGQIARHFNEALHSVSGAVLGSHVHAKEQTHQLRMDWKRAREEQAGLVWMVVEGGREIHSIPWEFILSDIKGPLTEDAAIVRKLTGYAPPPQEHRNQPLRILLVIARPHGPNDVSHRHVADEILKLNHDKATRGLKIDVLRGGGSLDQLQRRLKERNYQVVHFDMHGEIEDGVGKLRFESDEVDRSDDSNLCEPQEIAKMLRNHGVQLALFTACDSARPQVGRRSIGRSLAHEMATYGIPATVGMSQPIGDDAAKQFAAIFYKLVFASDQGSPELAHAFTAAKTEFMTELGRSGSSRIAEWRIPTLYLRSNPDFAIQFSPTDASGAPSTDGSNKDPVTLNRDFDHRLIDRSVFSKSRPVLVRGLRGTGKKQLLDDLEDWWRSAKYAETHILVDCTNDESIQNFWEGIELAERSSEDEICAAIRNLQTKAETLVAEDAVNGPFAPSAEVVFYFQKIDRMSDNEHLQFAIQQLTSLGAKSTAVHVVLSARSKPDWLEEPQLQTYDMLWLSSAPSRQLFREAAGREDDILISACSDLPGVINEIGGHSAVKDRTHSEPTIRYFDNLLPTDELLDELEKLNFSCKDIFAFGGMKGFPLPLIERDLLERYLRLSPFPAEGKEMELIASLEKLGLLTPMPDPRSSAHNQPQPKQFLRVHPYLPLVGRQKLREKLKVDKNTDKELPKEAELMMAPYKDAYAQMRKWRLRDFEVLRSGRRVELWLVNRSPNLPPVTPAKE